MDRDDDIDGDELHGLIEEHLDEGAVSDPAAAGAGDPPATSRKVRRRGRRTRMRSRTIAMKRLTKEELRQGALLYPMPEDVDRPQTRADC